MLNSSNCIFHVLLQDIFLVGITKKVVREVCQLKPVLDHLAYGGRHPHSLLAAVGHHR